MKPVKIKKFAITRFSWLADEFDNGITAEEIEGILNRSEKIPFNIIQPSERAKWGVTEITDEKV